MKSNTESLTVVLVLLGQVHYGAKQLCYPDNYILTKLSVLQKHYNGRRKQMIVSWSICHIAWIEMFLFPIWCQNFRGSFCYLKETFHKKCSEVMLPEGAGVAPWRWNCSFHVTNVWSAERCLYSRCITATTDFLYAVVIWEIHVTLSVRLQKDVAQ